MHSVKRTFVNVAEADSAEKLRQTAPPFPDAVQLLKTTSAALSAPPDARWAKMTPPDPLSHPHAVNVTPLRLDSHAQDAKANTPPCPRLRLMFVNVLVPFVVTRPFESMLISGVSVVVVFPSIPENVMLWRCSVPDLRTMSEWRDSSWVSKTI